MRRLHDFLAATFPFTASITIADNASTDDTWAVAQRLAAELDDVRAVHLDAKGRGRALQHVWTASTARVVAYMDVDLSTDLAALLPLVAPLMSGHSDVAIGSRLSRTARVVRGPKREFISRSLQPAAAHDAAHPLPRRAVRVQGHAHRRARGPCCRWSRTRPGSSTPSCWCSPSAAGCGSPRCRSTGWTIPDSRVDIVRTARDDLRGIARVGRALLRGDLPLREVRQAVGRDDDSALHVAGVEPRLTGQALRFGGIGVLSTLAYLALFLLLRPTTGAQVANLLALLVTAVANTAANRRYTFGVRGDGHGRHQLQGLVVFGLGPRPDQRLRCGCSTRCRRTRPALLELAVLVARQPRRDGAALRPVPRVGVPAPPRPRAATTPTTGSEGAR